VNILPPIARQSPCPEPASEQDLESPLPAYLLSPVPPCTVELVPDATQQTAPSKTEAELLADGQCEV
jgi:hypothetical protein